MEGEREMEQEGTGAVAEVELPQLAGVEAPRPAGAVAAVGDLSLVLDVPVELAVEIGRTRMTIREALTIGPGSIVTLDRMAGEPVDLVVNGKRIARGEVVAVDEEFALRVTEVVAPVSALDG
jgi:flagellar motor switch protein FliN/FliY